MKWFIKVLRHYADFSGRARRKEYWMFTLFNLLFFWAWSLVATLVVINAGKDIQKMLPTIYLIYFTVMALPGLAVSVRRLHDIGKSGGTLFIGLIPLIGGIWLFILMITEGREAENRFGKNPKSSPEIFGEREKLKNAGITLTVAACIAITGFLPILFQPYFLEMLQNFGLIIDLIACIMLLTAGIFLLDGVSIHETKGKTKNALLLLLVSSGLFFLLNVINISSGRLIAGIALLFFLSIALFAGCLLYAPQNKDLIRKTALVVIVFSLLDFLWLSYDKLSSGFYINHWRELLFSINILLPIACIVLAGACYPSKAKAGNSSAKENPTDTSVKKSPGNTVTPKSDGPKERFTLANLEKIRINTTASELSAVLGEPDFTMTAEEAFAMFGAVPASERGKEYRTYKTPYGDLQVAVKDHSRVVAVNGLEHIIEKMKAQLPEQKPDPTTTTNIPKEEVRFSIESFRPVVSIPGFTKEEAYQLLENYLTDNKPQKMNEEETELLKPLFLNLLMYFRHEAYLYAQTGRGFGGMCDACCGSINKNEFYLMGSWARCRKCALESIVSTLDWNYYLSHIITAIGEVPPSIVSQAYDIKDKIVKRREER